MASLIIVTGFLVYWTLDSKSKIWLELFFINPVLKWYQTIAIWIWMIGMPLLDFSI